MVELSEEEIGKVGGGVAPFIGAAIAVYSHFTATTVTGAVLSRVGLATAVYGVGAYLNNDS